MNPWRLIGFNSYQAVQDTYKPYIAVFKAAAVLASKECLRIGLDFSSSCKRNLPQYLKDVRVPKSIRGFRYWRAVTAVLACVAMFAISLNASSGSTANVGPRAAASRQSGDRSLVTPDNAMLASQGQALGGNAGGGPLGGPGGGVITYSGNAAVILPVASATTVHLPSSLLLQDLVSSSSSSATSSASSSLPSSMGTSAISLPSFVTQTSALRIEPPANQGANTVVYGEDQRLLPRETVEGIAARAAEAAEKKRQAHAVYMAQEAAKREARRKERRERAAASGHSSGHNSNGNANNNNANHNNVIRNNAATAMGVVPATSAGHRRHASGPARINYSALQDGIHVIITSDASKYQNWQARLCWWTFQKVQAQSDMKWFTRILHSTVTDDLMSVIPTFRVDPIDKNCDKDGGGGFGCEYPVANRPQAIADWLASGGPKGKWILVVETDYMFIKPIMVPTTPEAVGFPYRYMRMESAKHAHILRRYFPEEKGPLSKIPGTGCSPILIRVEDLVKIVPIWVDLTARIMNDAEAVAKLAWFREMYTYSIAAALAEVPHKLPAFPKSLIVEPPFQKGKLGQVKMIHIAGRTILEDKDHKKVWMFHKKTWQNGLPPEGIPLPPPGVEVPESVAFMVNLINEALLDMGMITEGPLLKKKAGHA